jgi:hypothetical protein
MRVVGEEVDDGHQEERQGWSDGQYYSFLEAQIAVYTLNVRTKLASVGSQDPSQRPRPNPEIHSEIHPDEGSAPGRFVAYAGVEK